MRRRAYEFFFAPLSPDPFVLLRVGVCAILLLQALFIAPELHDLFSRSGFLQGALTDYLTFPLARTLPGIVGDGLLLNLTFDLYVASLVVALSGYFPRTACAVAATLHWLLLGAGFWSTYGADRFAQIALFYLAVAPTRFGLRVLQIHLCLVYVSTGLAKAAGSDWWTGEAVWQALMQYGLPAFQNPGIAAHAGLVKAASWGTLALELTYPLYIWPRATRPFGLAAIIALHAGIALALGLVSFSAIMIVLNIAAFGHSPTGYAKIWSSITTSIRARRLVPSCWATDSVYQRKV